MSRQRIGIGGVVLGTALLIASFLWKPAMPKDALWSEDQAMTYQEASTKFHNDIFDKTLSEEELAASRAEYEAQRKRLDRAIAFNDSTPFYLRIVGVICGGLGIGVLKADSGNS